MLTDKTNHRHEYVHKPGTWYEVCECGEKRFYGLGNPPALCKVCHSDRQRDCIIDTCLPGGKMDPDSCYKCPDFY